MSGDDWDGSTFDRAILINARRSKAGIDEEYKYLDATYPGWRLKRQMLIERNDRSYDVITIELLDGATRSVHFDISSFMSASPGH